SRLDPASTQSTPQESGTATPDSHSAIDTLSEQDEGTLTPSSKQTTPTTSPNSFVRRKQKHKRSSSKDSKEMVALDTISTDSIPFLDGEEKG
ncbi:hypothetical protein GOODEAATRI_015708, partial [Goodea atripinnis]